jgi:hypothetical protein
MESERLLDEFRYELGLRERSVSSAGLKGYGRNQRSSGREAYVMTEICIHNDDKIACTELQSVDIGSTIRARLSAWTQSTLQNGFGNIPQTELACSGSEQDFVVSIELR